MAAITVNPAQKGSLFPEKLVQDLMTKVKGHSSLAKITGAEPIPFNGKEQFIFNMPNEIDIVAEGGAKSHGGITLEPVTIVPIKFEYGARVTDEFLYASDEEKLDILGRFADGFSKKVARGLDLAAFYGVNPRTGNASSVINGNDFTDQVEQVISYVAASADDNLDSAIALVKGSQYNVNGMAFSPVFGDAMAKIKVNNVVQYPEFRFGQTPSNFAGITLDINNTVNGITTDNLTNQAIVGDFSMFSWGYSKEIPMTLIQFGDPDNSGRDLAGHNEVYIRAEVYLGWGILDPDAFALVQQSFLDVPPLAAVDGETVLFDTAVKNMQTGITVGTGSISGRLKFIEGGLAQSGPLAGDGYFLALQLDKTIDWTKYTSVKVGLNPSEGTGLVEIIDDPDKNGVFKISSTSQVFKIVATDGTHTTTRTWKLRDLILETPEE